MPAYRKREEFDGPFRGLLEAWIDDDPDMLRCFDFLYESDSYLLVTVKCVKFEEGGAIAMVNDGEHRHWYIWPKGVADEYIIAECKEMEKDVLDRLAEYALHIAYQHYHRN